MFIYRVGIYQLFFVDISVQNRLLYRNKLINAILKKVLFVLKIDSLNKSGKSGKNIQWIM